MKRTERHRLKENELSHVLTSASTRLSEKRGSVGTAAAVIALVLVAAAGYWVWKTRAEARAQVMLSDAVRVAQSPIQEPKPGAKPAPDSYATTQARDTAALAKFTDVFNAHPSTDAGVAARYYAASLLAALGKPGDAATRYQEVVDRAGSDDFYGRMAQLGVIQASTQAKQYDKAISVAQALVNNTSDETIPRDALLMELGRVQAAAGKTAEAKQTLDKVIADFPESPYIEEARQLLSTLT